MKHIVFDIETVPQDEAKLLALAPEFTAAAIAFISGDMGTGYFHQMIMTGIPFGRSVYNTTRICIGQTSGIPSTRPELTTLDGTTGPRFQLRQSRPPIIQACLRTGFLGPTIQAGLLRFTLLALWVKFSEGMVILALPPRLVMVVILFLRRLNLEMSLSVKSSSVQPDFIKKQKQKNYECNQRGS